jgi:TRAP-type mannitol/chloroaromatic compound transport system permease small subunit
MTASLPYPRVRAIIKAIDAISIWSGKIVGWLILPMVGSLVYEVFARYLFNAPTVWAYDMTYMLYGSFFMLGAAYTLQRKGHIRTDMFYGAWSPRRQGLVDAVCYVLFFFPGMVVFLFITWDFFAVSFGQGERVVTSPWMPIVYPLKGMMFVATFLLILQGVAEFLRSCYAATKGEWP